MKFSPRVAAILSTIAALLATGAAGRTAW